MRVPDDISFDNIWALIRVNLTEHPIRQNQTAHCILTLYADRKGTGDAKYFTVMKNVFFFIQTIDSIYTRMHNSYP